MSWSGDSHLSAKRLSHIEIGDWLRLYGFMCPKRQQLFLHSTSYDSFYDPILQFYFLNKQKNIRNPWQTGNKFHY